MSRIGGRQVAAAFAAGLAGGATVLLLASAYSVEGGYGFLSPYQGIGSVLGFAGTTGLAVGFLVDFLIPIVVALVMLGALAALSLTRWRLLEFTTPRRAASEGAFVGLVVFTVFYIPVIELLTNRPPVAALTTSLLFGFVEHIVFGTVIGLVLFAVGGPVRFRVPSLYLPGEGLSVPEPGLPPAYPPPGNWAMPPLAPRGRPEGSTGASGGPGRGDRATDEPVEARLR